MYMNLVNSWRVNRLMTISAALLFFLFTLGFFSFYQTSETTLTIPTAVPTHWAQDNVTARFFFELNKPTAVDAPHYQPFGAIKWDLPENAPWSSSLGEDLCIIDLDNRPFSESGQIFGPEPMSWHNPTAVHGLSLGILNHWIYAKIHGYKYYYVHINEYKDRRNSWKKAPVVSRILKDHRVCIFVDSDATFAKLNLPFEWLLNYWRIRPGEQSLALAFDPEAPNNADKKGVMYLNTGFFVAQNLPRTHEILAAWEVCPDEGGTHPGCTEFRTNSPGRPTDQGGFGNFIRYEFDRPTDILSLSCDEGNGYIESKSGCDGIFVSHWWTGKDSWLKEGVARQLPGPFLATLHERFLVEKDQLFITEPDLMAKPIKGPNVPIVPVNIPIPPKKETPEEKKPEEKPEEKKPEDKKPEAKTPEDKKVEQPKPPKQEENAKNEAKVDAAS